MKPPSVLIEKVNEGRGNKEPMVAYPPYNGHDWTLVYAVFAAGVVESERIFT